MKFYFLIFFCIIKLNAWSQIMLPNSSLNIPDSLKKDVNAVYVLEELIVSIKSASKMDLSVHNIITMLNKDALGYSIVRIPVDRFRKLDEVHVTVYNQFGLQTGSFKKKDFSLRNSYSESTLASDHKLYEFDVPVPATPCTIEIEYTLNCNAYVDIPSWFFGSSSASYITSRFIVNTDTQNEIKYKIYNATLKPEIIKNGTDISYIWELKNAPAPKNENNSYGPIVYMPWVDVSPVSFSYDDYPGSLKNWQEFGKWCYPFYEEATPFSSERTAYFNQLVNNSNNQKEKITTLYKYLQKETRYVSIQFGIGGFKPFPVSFVENKKYGDCKALTGYMKSMLQSVGIRSYAALINAGENEYPVDPQFASNNFNHVILCVPLEKDTVWLECTGKLTSAGILSGFTENRNALLLTENGGVLVKTPSSLANSNQWKAKTIIELDEDGSALVKSRVFVSGEFWDAVHSRILERSSDDLKKALIQIFDFKMPDDMEVKLMNDSAFGHNIQITLSYSQLYDFKTGVKYFFSLRPNKLNTENIKPAEKRELDYVFDYPFITSDSTIYLLPSKFKPENLPQNKQIKNNFAFYTNDASFDESKRMLAINTKIILENHIIPPAFYNDVARSFELMVKDEGQKLVLRKE